MTEKRSNSVFQRLPRFRHIFELRDCQCLKKVIKTAEMNKETRSEKKPRDYQVELLYKALQNNAIVYLGTGAGKTFIASMIIKEMKADILIKKKKTVFLVHRVPLVSQQAKFFAEQNPDLKGTLLKEGRTGQEGRTTGRTTIPFSSLF